MKPHEREWIRETRDAFKTQGARVEVDSYGSPEDEAQLVAFFMAAPEMARLLLGLHRGFEQGYRMTPADNASIVSILAKAGVLP